MKRDPITDEFIELSVFMFVAVVAIAVFVFTPLGDMAFAAALSAVEYIFGGEA